MRVLVVRPGPWFSVEDVARGWSMAFARMSNEPGGVQEFAMGERLDFFSNAKIKKANGRYVHAFSEEISGALTMEGLLASTMVVWPEIVFIVSGFYLTERVLEILKARRKKIVLLCTESPYEENRQLAVARSGYLDAILLNDPTHIDKYRGLAPIVYYTPHCYDPDKHAPGPAVPAFEGDVSWTGTVYESRLALLKATDFSGLRLRFGGNWTWVEDDEPLKQHVVHDWNECIDNDRTIQLYRSCPLTFNPYRKEAARPDLVEGWALGPREVEATMTGALCVREPRGEGDEVLPMLPTYSSPEELGDLLRWWRAHDRDREETVAKAQAALAERTFDNAARRLLTELEAVPV